LIADRTKPDLEARRALIAEFALLSTLRHPSIVNVIDYGFDDMGRPFYTTALLDDAIPFLVAARTASLALRCQWVKEMLDALAYMHRRGVLHRNLNPENVVIRQQRVVIRDFGLAGAGHSGLPETGEALAHLAPEQISTHGPGGTPTLAPVYYPQTDLYQLGILVYQLFAGHLPFMAPQPPALIAQILQEPADPSPFSQHSITGAVLMNLLAKCPADRYTNGEAALAAWAEAGNRAYGSRPEHWEARAPTAPSDVPLRSIRQAPFIGRAHELTTLDLALDSACEGRGSIWSLEGEIGIGKSRLLEELRLMALAKGLIVLRGQASLEAGHAYQLWDAVLRAVLLYAPLGSSEYAALKTYVPDIEALIGAPVQPAPMLSALAAQVRLAVTVLGALQHLVGPALIIFEDIQWAGEESLELLDRIALNLNTCPVTIVVSCRRGEPPHNLTHIPPLQRLTLEPLSEAECQQLIDGLVRIGALSSPPDPTTRHTLYILSNGNPLLLIDLARHLQADPHSDLYAADPVIRATVVGSQFQRFTPGLLPILKSAALLGRVIDVATLGRLFPWEEVESWISGCAETGIIEWHNQAWRFTHDQERASVLDLLTPDEARQLNQRIAHVLEVQSDAQDDADFTQFNTAGMIGIGLEPLRPVAERAFAMLPPTTGGPTPVAAARLAHYWQSAGNWEREQYYAIRAGRDALQTGAYTRAIAYFQRALDLAAQSQIPLPREQRALVERWLGECAINLGHFEEALAHLHAALVAMGLPAPKGRWQLAIATAHALLIQARHRMLPMLPVPKRSPGDDHWRQAAQVYERVAEASYFTDRRLLASMAAVAMLNAAERIAVGPERIRAASTIYMAIGLSPLRRLAPHYLAYLDSMITASVDPLAEAAALRTILAYTIGNGQWAAAEKQAQRALDISRSALDFRIWGDSIAHLNRIAYFQGDFDRALARGEEIQQIASLSDNIQHKGWGCDHQGLIYLLRGDYARAITHLERAAALYAGAPQAEQVLRATTYAALAFAYWECGEISLSDAYFERLPLLILGGPGLVNANLEALSCYADGLRQRIEGGQARSYHLKQMAVVVALLKRRIPNHRIAEPKAAYWEGVLADFKKGIGRVEIQPGHAVRAWRHSLRCAEALNMRYDALRAHLQLATAAIGPLECAAHHDAALALARALKLTPVIEKLG
jgi:tetratricopeptide (TPR) repeat protein